MAKRKKIKHVPSVFDSPDAINSDDLDLQITIDTLSSINHQDLHLPKFKELRRALFSIFNSINPHINSVQKVSTALETNDYDSALYSLALMRAQDHIPKLGSVQRWVRSSACASDKATYHQLLDAIIRTADPSQIALLDDFSHSTPSNNLYRYPTWSFDDPNSKSNIDDAFTKHWEFQLLETEKNHKEGTHLQILGHAPNSIKFDHNQSIRQIPVPFIKDAFVLVDAISPFECLQLKNAADNIGFVDDSGYSFTADITTGSAGCVWLVDSSVLDPIYSRIKSFLPQKVGSKSLLGINARFRFYKYSKGAEYRPHIDGSWPGSGIVNGKYEFDAFNDRWSCLTLLIYLNDDFEGGETSFFWPSSKEGILNARGIKPKEGSILVFAHGNTSGALLHEGSSVINGYNLLNKLTDLPTTQQIQIIQKSIVENLNLIYSHIWKLFSKPHAQIRYIALIIIDNLFNYSGEFRKLLIDDLPEFVQLLNLNHKINLLPLEFAKKVHQEGLLIISTWNSKYAKTFKQLDICVTNLKENGISFTDIHFQPSIIQSERATRINNLHQKMFTKTFEEYQDKKSLIWENIKKMEACFNILIQKYNHSNNMNVLDITTTSFKDIVREYGLGSTSYNLQININPQIDPLAKETQDNTIVFEELRECIKLIHKKHIDLVNNWLKAISKLNVNSDERNQFLKALIDLKAHLLDLCEKSNDLGIQNVEKNNLILPDLDDIQDSDDDEIFVDAQDESKSTVSIKKETPKGFQKVFSSKIEPFANLVDDFPVSNEIDPKRNELLQKAPIVEYGEDLDYWDKKSVIFNTTGIEYQHRFLGTGDGVREISENTLKDLRKRTIILEPLNPEPISSCGALLKNGKLCTRRDLKKCPLHGIIVPRDNQGTPIDPLHKEIPKIPTWQLLENDIDALYDNPNKKQKLLSAKPSGPQIRLKKLLSKSKATKEENFEKNMKLRDRQAFKW